MGVSALSQVLNIITLHPLGFVHLLLWQPKPTPKLPRNTSSTLVKKNQFPTQPAIYSFQNYPEHQGHLHFVNWSFLDAHDAGGDPDHSSRGYLSQALTTELGFSTEELQAAAPGLLPWQLTSRNKRNPHALRNVLCQNLLQKYLSSTIINRKYSDLFSVAGLQSFHIAGLQPTKAKTQNKQNKNKVPLSNHKGNSGYLLK